MFYRMQGFVSARTRAQLLDVLLSAQIAVLALEVLAWLIVLVVGEGGLSRVLVRGAGRADPFTAVLLLVATVVFALWARRVAANVPALGLYRRRVSAGSAVVLTLLPVVNLVAVPLVGRALWLDSDALPPAGQRADRVTGVWIAALSLSVIAAAASNGLEWLHLRAFAALQAVSTAAWLAAGAMCLTVVRAVQARQDARELDLELRAAVPAPTADRLR